MGSEKELHQIDEDAIEENDSSYIATNNMNGPKYKTVDENKMLEILNRMNRVVMILKVIFVDDYFSRNIGRFANESVFRYFFVHL